MIGVTSVLVVAGAVPLAFGEAGGLAAESSIDPRSPRLAPVTAALGGWRALERGKRASISWDAGRAGSRSLKLADVEGSGIVALTAPVPGRARVTVRGNVNIYRMRLGEGALRPLVWVDGRDGGSQQAGITRKAGVLRWAAWHVTDSGVRGRVSVSRVKVRSRTWMPLKVRTVWTAKTARTTVTVGGRVVIQTHPLDLRRVRAARVSIGLGRASRRAQSAVVLLRAAAVAFRSRPDPDGLKAAQPDMSRPRGPLPAEVQPYGPQFAFNERVPDSAATDPRSAAIVAQFAANASNGKVALVTEGEVPPVYVAEADDPWKSVTVGGQRVRFRVPAGAQTGGGSDRPLVVLDPEHPDFGPDTELRLWQASIGTSWLSASGAGLFHYNNDGAILNPTGTLSLGLPFLGHGTGSGLSVLAGLIRGEEVRLGEIRHALRFTYSAADFSNRFRPPAIKTDQPNGTFTRNPAGAMDMGMRLQLDRSVDCNARTVPGQAADSAPTRFLRMVCRALQDYGMIAVDGTGTGGILFMGEDGATADWTTLIGAPHNGNYGYLLRDQTTPGDGLTRSGTSGIPWSRLRVLAQSDF